MHADVAELAEAVRALRVTASVCVAKQLKLKLYIYADVAELADALDSKSSGKPCGFESHHQHQKKQSKDCFNHYILVGLEKERTEVSGKLRLA